MYLRTPKRYTRHNRPRLISLRWVWLWILGPVIIFLAIGVYEHRETFIPTVERMMDDLVQNVQSGVATATAPTPIPTPDPAQALDRANILWSQGSLDQAAVIYQDVLDAVPNEVSIHARLTLSLILQDRLEEARAAAEQTVTANPFSPEAWSIRAMAMEMSGRFGDAIASALHALELDPDNARAMAFLAESYLDVNQPERALTTVNSALELDPSSFEAYRIRGRIIQESVFDFEAARADYQTAYDLAPNIPYPAIDLAWVEFRLDDLEGAIQTLEDVLDRTPENSQALYAMGSMYYQGVGDYNLASDFLTRCVQANPLSVSCHYLLGRSQMNLDQITAAATSLRTAIDLGSDDPKHFWWSGNAQIALGNCAEALSFLRPGYQLATEAQDPSLMEDYNFLLGQCGANVSPQVTPTPTA